MINQIRPISAHNTIREILIKNEPILMFFPDDDDC